MDIHFEGLAEVIRVMEEKCLYWCILLPSGVWSVYALRHGWDAAMHDECGKVCMTLTLATVWLPLRPVVHKVCGEVDYALRKRAVRRFLRRAEKQEQEMIAAVFNSRYFKACYDVVDPHAGICTLNGVFIDCGKALPNPADGCRLYALSDVAYDLIRNEAEFARFRGGAEAAEDAVYPSGNETGGKEA